MSIQIYLYLMAPWISAGLLCAVVWFVSELMRFGRPPRSILLKSRRLLRIRWVVALMWAVPVVLAFLFTDGWLRLLEAEWRIVILPFLGAFMVAMGSSSVLNVINRQAEGGSTSTSLVWPVMESDDSAQDSEYQILDGPHQGLHFRGRRGYWTQRRCVRVHQGWLGLPWVEWIQ